MASTAERVPAHLRRFVVEQDYAAYTAVDQAVWRFVLLQMYDRLERTAHPAYARGLREAGMSVERIPSIAEMDRCLGEFGWGAVCVDGFIPPRAFQEFQALGILPIAADIRRLEHLPYTPAPDIIHEAAGHAPILPDREYAAFLRRIGEYGTRAFASSRDAELYAAVRQLSFVKEQRDATPDDIEQSERRLAELVARPAEASEAARLARLYWWTVEYGLVGTPDDYKLYGAGLLSSLAESHFCHDAAVRKLPLDVSCMDVDYDITRPQPQLFVARDFAHLGQVLDEACAGFAFRRGGLAAVETARDAGEVATLTLGSGLQVTGKVVEVIAEAGEPVLVLLRSACALGRGGRLLAGEGRATFPHGLVLAIAPTEWAGLGPEALRTRFAHGSGVRIPYAAGVQLEGVAPRAVAAPLPALVLAHASGVRRGNPLFRDWPLVLAGGPIAGVRAGTDDAAFWPEAQFPEQKVPLRHAESEAERSARALYEALDAAGGEAAFAALYQRVCQEQPNDWLLRWNILRAFTELGVAAPLRAQLLGELTRLEEHYQQRNPIAMGLRYLGYEPGAAPRRAAS